LLVAQSLYPADLSPESKTVKRNIALLSSPSFSDKKYYSPPAQGTRYHCGEERLELFPLETVPIVLGNGSKYTW